MSLSPTLHLSTLTSLTSPLLPKKHPLDNIYPPQLTFTYTPSQATPQIPFMEMFLFPEECRLKNKQEREQWHAFVSHLVKYIIDQERKGKGETGTTERREKMLKTKK